MLWPDDPHIFGVASDMPLTDIPLPLLDLNNISVIADFLLRMAGRPLAEEDDRRVVPFR